MIGRNPSNFDRAFEAAAENIIWVSESGSDTLAGESPSKGSFECPYATIDAAVAAMSATKNIVCILPGDYTLTSALSVTLNDGAIIGIGGQVNITGFATGDYCFKVVMAATSGTKEFTFKGLNIIHTDDATQVGIQVNNTSMTAKVNVYVQDCEFSTGGGNSIDSDHAATGNAVRIYCDRCTFEGPVNVVVADGGDRFRFTDCTLRGGFVSDAGNYDAEVMFRGCLVLHEGVTGGHANQRGFALDCVTETDADPNVYAGFDTSDFAGSHTEVIWPAS